MEKQRCKWAVSVSPVYEKYHDEQWGVPVYDDHTLFEMLILESFHCGLSWLIILNKREHFSLAFDGFIPENIANYKEDKVNELMLNKNIVRNRRKIMATIENAKAFLSIQKEFGSFSSYIWGFTKGETITNKSDVFLNHSPLSDMVAKDMKRRNMHFLGTVTVYSYLQAVGIINDHETSCFRYKEIQDDKNQCFKDS